MLNLEEAIKKGPFKATHTCPFKSGEKYYENYCVPSCAMAIKSDTESEKGWYCGLMHGKPNRQTVHEKKE